MRAIKAKLSVHKCPISPELFLFEYQSSNLTNTWVLAQSKKRQDPGVVVLNSPVVFFFTYI